MNANLKKESSDNKIQFPKYTTQLINWANQNAQGTRPKVVGQLSDLFPEFMKGTDEVTKETWAKWYLAKYPNAIDTATEKIWGQVQLLTEAIQLIDKEMVRKWVYDLVINKTYDGLYVQKDILDFLAKERHTTYRLATPEEESKGIDGYVGDIPYSIKPESYKTMDRLPENISVKMIYYTKTKTGLKLDIED